jgi:hypothetical protein
VASGGILAIVGYLLSPLSWWNDAFINLPLAVGFAWVAGFLYPPAREKSVFEALIIIGYWLTNVAGFILLHKGGEKIWSGKPQPFTWKSLLKDVVISLLYTTLIVVLVKWGWVHPPAIQK